MYGVAVSSWKTSMSSWAAAVMRSADPDANRYTRFDLPPGLDTTLS